MPVTIKISDIQAKAVSRRLYKAAGKLDGITAYAINKTTKQLAVNFKKEMRKQTTAKASFLSKRIWRDLAKRKKAVGVFRFGTRYNIPLRAFRIRQTKRGVAANILVGGSSSLYPGAFIVKVNRTSKSGKDKTQKDVFRRQGKDRLPIDRVQGINATKIVRGIIPKIRKQAPDILRKEIERRKRYLALKQSGAVK